MSEQIREQISAFLDGELPGTETELLLKRLARDAALRDGFGRYALIGEALRGSGTSPVTRGFAGKVSLAIGAEPGTADRDVVQARAPRWWRPFAGAAVAAGVAAVAVVAFQQRTDAPGAPAPGAAAALRGMTVTADNGPGSRAPQASREAISYTVPAAPAGAAAVMPPARLTNYVFAHSRYSSGLDQRGVLADLLIEADEQPPVVEESAAHVAP